MLLNSWNAIFACSARSFTHADRIRTAIAEQTGIDIPVIVKTAKDLIAVETEHPLATTATDPSRLLVAFTRERRHLEELAPLSALTEVPEQFHIG